MAALAAEVQAHMTILVPFLKIEVRLVPNRVKLKHLACRASADRNLVSTEALPVLGGIQVEAEVRAVQVRIHPAQVE